MPEGNPYPTLRPAWAGTEHVAWDEGYEAGAAAGVAAGEARARELAALLRVFYNGEAQDEDYRAASALLSEEPGLQESTTTDTRSDA